MKLSNDTQELRSFSGPREMLSFPFSEMNDNPHSEMRFK